MVCQNPGFSNLDGFLSPQAQNRCFFRYFPLINPSPTLSLSLFLEPYLFFSFPILPFPLIHLHPPAMFSRVLSRVPRRVVSRGSFLALSSVPQKQQAPILCNQLHSLVRASPNVVLNSNPPFL